MSKRLHVVMSDDEYAEIEEAAASAMLTVSGWVRGAQRAARVPVLRGGRPALGAVRERPPSYGDLLARVIERYGLHGDPRRGAG